MSYLIEKNLDHLAKLCRLELSGEDKIKLLPQLDNILAFVKQLESCDTSDIDITNGSSGGHFVGGNVCLSNMTEKFLKNVSHPLVQNSIEITEKLADTKK